MSTGPGSPGSPQDWQRRVDSLADRLEELAVDLGQLRYEVYQIRQDLQQQEIAAQEAAPPVSPGRIEQPPVAAPVAPMPPVVPVEPKVVPVQKPVPPVSAPVAPKTAPAAPPAQPVAPVLPAGSAAVTPPTVPQSVFVGKSPVAMTPEAAGQSTRKQTPAEQAGPSSAVTDLLSSFRNIGNLEARMGGAWLAWLGGICVLLTAAWFFKYSIEQGWINPWMRVTSGWLTAAALVGIGEWACRRNMPWFAAGVTGAGLGVGYIASYAASPLLYGLVSVPASYGILSIVTALGLVQAVRLNQLPTAVLALLGGFLTLVLVRTDHPTAAGLLGYLMALNIGALGAGQLRRWPVLRLLAWPGTAILIAIWLVSTHKPGAELPACLSLMPALFVLYQLDMFYWRVRRPEEPSYIINTLSALNCSAILLAIWQTVGAEQVALIAGTAFFAVAALQVGLARALWVLSSAEQNRRVAITFYGQASMAAAVGFPVAFERMLVVAGWAVQAVTLGWLVRYARAVGLRLKVPALLIACLVYIVMYFDESSMVDGYVSVRCWLAGMVALASGVTAYLFACWQRRTDWWLDRVLGEVCVLLAGMAGVIAGGTLLSKDPSLVLWIWTTAAATGVLGLLSYKAAVLRMPTLMPVGLAAALVMVIVGLADPHRSPELVKQVHALGAVTWSLLLPVGVALSGLAFWNAWLMRHAKTMQHLDGVSGEWLSAVATFGLLLILRQQLADDSPAYAVLAAASVVLVLAVLARLWRAPAYWAWSVVTWAVAAGYWMTAATIGERFTASGAIPKPWVVMVPPFANATFAAVLVLAGVAWVAVKALRTSEQLGSESRKAIAAGVLLVVAYSLIHGTSFEVDRWFPAWAPEPAVRSVTYMEAITLTAVWAGFALAYLLVSLWRSLRALWWFSLCVGAVAAGKLLLSDTLGQRLIEGGLTRWLSVAAFANPAMLCAGLLVGLAVAAVIAARRSEWLNAGERNLAESLLPVVAGYVLIHALSFELDRWFQGPGAGRFADLLHAERVGLSVLWALLALVYVVVGLTFTVRSLRLFGLVIFAVTAGKVLLHDMAKAKVVYRMLSALALGVLSLIGSFAYQRVRRMGLVKETADKEMTDKVSTLAVFGSKPWWL